MRDMMPWPGRNFTMVWEELRAFIFLKTEAGSLSEMLVHFNQTMMCHIPGDSNLCSQTT